ncbi:hypothetical protein GCM10023189_43310 [Nibrella saemangeumensis]|uniref:AAA+ ATPase domain-containing protein n=1 Tax=Nibrella saemangeumensis TaxID=1084526 RepID=A0ABP8NEW2_9BACT
MSTCRAFHIVRQSKPKKSFRVASVMGTFDLQEPGVSENFAGVLDFPQNWKIGLIVGASGTGKSTIARELFPDAYVTGFNYTSESLLDDMPAHCSVQEITSMLNSVGFSSPPGWLKPYHVLSNGEKMRVDLANALLSEQKLVVFDEFTSVVDRTVAQAGSFAVQKAIRKSDKQFIAVTCHYDVADYLRPDWIFDTNTMRFRVPEVTPEPGKHYSTWNCTTSPNWLKNAHYGEFLAAITIYPTPSVLGRKCT